MTKALISGGRVLRPDLKTYDPADVLVEDGFIIAIEPPQRIVREDLDRIDASDRLLVPGSGVAHLTSGIVGR